MGHKYHNLYSFFRGGQKQCVETGGKIKMQNVLLSKAGSS